ncbi:hypothetical protein F5X98DRAFT_345490 [Xylaria grammica]|nr:hypothetical protein F5X98DRAFT_345490 [Xylaria grammica]
MNRDQRRDSLVRTYDPVGTHIRSLRLEEYIMDGFFDTQNDRPVLTDSAYGDSLENA